MRRISSIFSQLGQFLFGAIQVIIGITLGIPLVLLAKLFPPLGRKIGEIIQKYSGNDPNASPEERAELQETAIAMQERMLQFVSRKRFPVRWAAMQNQLGLAYYNRMKGDKAENIELAIAAYQRALELYTKEAFPTDWATIQNNLGLAYGDRILGDTAENLEKAIAAYQNALEVRTKETFPSQWAMTQNNLGSAYKNRIKGDKAENLEKAIAVYQQILEVRTKETFPWEWAESQNGLGSAYWRRIKEDKAENIEKAIAAYEKTLSVYTKEAFPKDWAGILNNLGCAYWNRIKGDRAENIELAIAAHQKALSVRTREAFPQDWARSQNNLGAAYNNRIRGDKADNIELAIAAHRNALSVHTREAFSQDWALSQNNLGVAYNKRIKGDKAENLELAIEAFQQALQICTPKAFPIECLHTSWELGHLHFNQKNWQPAINAYETATAAVELLREWASTDARREEILENAIDVYQKLIQSYLNTNQPQKALITVERAKSRNLVELAVSRNLHPQGDIPPKLTQDLDRLRRQLQATSQQFNSSGGNSPNDIQTPLPPETAELRQPQQQQTLQQRQQLELQLQESREELDMVLDAIAQLDPSFSLTQRVKAISFDEIRELVADGETALVEWYLTGKTLVAFVVYAEDGEIASGGLTVETENLTSPTPPRNDNHNLTVETENLTPNDKKGLQIYQYSTADLKKLKKRTDAYLRLYNRKSKRWRQQLPQRLQNFADILHIDQIFAQIPTRCQRLILIPHLDLYLLPLHALPVGNKPLIDLFPKGVRYAPSCQLLQLVQKRQRPHFHNLLAIQTPTSDLYEKDFGCTDAIKKQFPNSHILPEGKATKSQLLQEPQLPKAHNLFFFCHGSFNLASPIDSALELADDNLTLGDILAHLDLKNCRLVTLSACETALADHQKVTDNYVGLPSGFLLAGSTNVLATLWSVQPEPTAIFMVKFYQEQKLQNYDNMAVALNQTQAWLRDSTVSQFQEWLSRSPLSLSAQSNLKGWLGKNLEEKPFASPYFWAPFCLIGKGE